MRWARHAVVAPVLRKTAPSMSCRTVVGFCMAGGRVFAATLFRRGRFAFPPNGTPGRTAVRRRGRGAAGK